jgi:hypothetical protein
VTRAPLAQTTAFLPSVREVAWEIAHEGFQSGNGDSCNGRLFLDRLAAAGYNAQCTYIDATSAQNALTGWLQNPSLCPIIMGTYTQIAVAIAHDSHDAYALGVK